MKLEDLVGGSILVQMPRSGDEARLWRMKLLGVEAGGIWVESQDITNRILQTVGVTSATRTPIVFLPYHQISLAMTSIPETALDEKAFGL